MSQDREETGRLLRQAADAAVDGSSFTARDAPAHVGEPGWWGRQDPRHWEQLGFLDVIEAEYGLVARWWIIAIREALLFGLVFWLVAFALGLALGERQTMVVVGQKVSALSVAAGTAVLLRLCAEAVVRGVRRSRLGA